MSLLEHEPVQIGAHDAQALFEEARARTRRRRRLRAAVTLALASTAVGVYLGARAGSAPGVLAQTASTPFVNVRAFAHDGELAFVSHGRLWVLDGRAGSVRELRSPRGLTPASPSFSRDGRWLAYLDQPPPNGDGGPAQLWLAHADGSSAHRVGALAVDQLVGWSPHADVLAAITDITVRFPQPAGIEPQPAVLTLVSPHTGARRLMALAVAAARWHSLWAAAWSPSGAAVAVTVYSPLRGQGSSVRSYPLDGGPPTRWFSIRNDQRLAGICGGSCGSSEVIADLAGWWRGWGITFWATCCGSTHGNDGTALELIRHPGATPQLLPATLSDRVTDAIAPGPSGELALVASGNGGREIGAGKEVEDCSATRVACTPLPRASVWQGADPQTHCPVACRFFRHPPSGKPGSGVSLDPSWSPDGRYLAYVKAPVALTGGGPSPQWYGAHELYLYDTRSDSTRRLGPIRGASVPAWSADGRQLLYVAGDGLWLASAQTGRAVEIEHPLLPPLAKLGLAQDYYGQIDWTAQFGWWSR